MDIDSYIDFMIRQNTWIEDTSRFQNKNRYRAEDFSTEDFTCNWDIEGIIHMLEVSSDYQRFALVTVRMKMSELSASDEVAGEVTSDGIWIDQVIGIFAIQGHSRVKAHPHLFGWQRLDWRECPILFHQTDAANHQSIVTNGLYPGGPAKYLSKTEGHHRWCVYASLADGHGHFANCSMIDGKHAKPHKFRSYGNVYCLSTYYITVTMKIDVWRTDADCAMIMGWIPPAAIPYSFDCNNFECWHQDKGRHQILNDQCHDMVADRLRARFEQEKKERIAEEKRTADAAAAEGRQLMPEQFHDMGPKPPPKRLEEVVYKPRWSEQKYVEGSYDPAAGHKPFWGDADQCYREGKWGRIKKAMKKSEMPGDGPNGRTDSARRPSRQSTGVSR